jgi:hypothetical protein
VGLVPDLLDTAGKPTFGAEPLAVLDEAPEIARVWLPERHKEIPPGLALEYDALYLTQSRVMQASVTRAVTTTAAAMRVEDSVSSVRQDVIALLYGRLPECK